MGQVVADRYRIVEELGQGGMATVYRAEHLRLPRPFAIKVLHPELTSQAEMVARFEREAIAQARINHPNVAAAVDCGSFDDGDVFLVLEYISGTSLRARLAAPPPLVYAEVLGIARQIAAGLVAAHAAGVVHRDLKPENVMLLEGDAHAPDVKVLDFGIAKLTEGPEGEMAPLTRLGSVFGTPEYMSPEQAQGAVADARSDLYSLGIILYEMLAGTTPFQHSELVTVLTRQIHEPPPPLPDSVPAPLTALIMALLSKSPVERPATAELVERELTELEKASLTPKPKIREPRSTRFLIPGLLGLLVLMVALVVFVSHPRRPPLSLDQVVSDVERRIALIERARGGDISALTELEKLPAGSRSGPEWLAIGAGRAQNREWPGALDALEMAVRTTPSMSHDASLAYFISEASRQPKTSTRALDFASAHLGSVGADIIFATWDGAANNRAPGADLRAAKLKVDQLAEDPRISPSLRVYFRLRQARSCTEVKQLLPEVVQNGDARSLPLLRRYTSDRGCGLLRLADCYPCLRGQGDLDAALRAAKQRGVPDFSLLSLSAGGGPSTPRDTRPSGS